MKHFDVKLMLGRRHCGPLSSLPHCFPQSSPLMPWRSSLRLWGDNKEFWISYVHLWISYVCLLPGLKDSAFEKDFPTYFSSYSEQVWLNRVCSFGAHVSLSPLFSASQHLLSLPLICLLICASDLSAWNRFSPHAPPRNISKLRGLTLSGPNKARELISCFLMPLWCNTHTRTHTHVVHTNPLFIRENLGRGRFKPTCVFTVS